ncbi:hypothetical protein ACFX12_033963 [Malus domestica]
MASGSDSGFDRSHLGTPYYVPGKKFPLYVPPSGYIRPSEDMPKDSVKKFDSVEVAAKVESVLFENLGARPVSLPHRAICKFLWIPSIKDLHREILLGKMLLKMLVRMSNEVLERKYLLEPCGLEEDLYA